MKKGKNLVIPDTRFPREYEFLKDLGATKVYVSSATQKTNVQPFDLLLAQYSFDLVLPNNGTIQHLGKTVIDLVIDS